MMGICAWCKRASDVCEVNGQTLCQPCAARSYSRDGGAGTGKPVACQCPKCRRGAQQGQLRVDVVATAARESVGAPPIPEEGIDIITRGPDGVVTVAEECVPSEVVASGRKHRGWPKGKPRGPRAAG